MKEDFLLAMLGLLNTKNVTETAWVDNSGWNKKRARAGRTELFSHHVVNVRRAIIVRLRAVTAAGVRNGVRAHFVMGHFKTAHRQVFLVAARAGIESAGNDRQGIQAVKHLARLAYEWGQRCFGEAHMADTRVRSLRLVEEAVELAQAYDVPREQLLKLIEHVYGRPRGDPWREMGGVLMTAAVLCEWHEWSMEDVMVDELSRVLAKDRKMLAIRNDEKISLGLTGK